MTVERMVAGDTVVVRVAGRMDAISAGQFESECGVCLAEGATRLVADFSGLTYVSSMGLRSLVSVAKVLRERGGGLRVCCVNGLVRQVFQITGLDQVFRPYDSLDAALTES